MTQREGIGTGLAPYLETHCPDCTILLAPLLVGADLLGALVLLASSEHALDSDDLTIVRSLSQLASVSLRLVDEVGREREERTALLTSTGEGIYGIDPAGPCTFMNRSGGRILGEVTEQQAEHLGRA